MSATSPPSATSRPPTSRPPGRTPPSATPRPPGSHPPGTPPHRRRIPPPPGSHPPGTSPPRRTPPPPGSHSPATPPPRRTPPPPRRTGPHPGSHPPATPPPPGLLLSPPPPQLSPPPPPYEPPPPPSLSSSSSVSAAEIAVIVAAVVMFGVAALLIILYVLQHRRRCESDGGSYSNPAVRPFKYEELESATNGFAEANVLGVGGFGFVYRGTLSEKEVAIKKLKPEGHQGETEFGAEVETISRVHHRNLVSLVGYCRHEDQRLLVYEYVPNKTLDFHLHGRGPVAQALDWPKRWGIALGSAKGLAYLHEDCDPKIIHRYIKAANILLDDNFEPKVADFGLAKFVPTDMSHVSTQVKGTFGYITPEYAASGRFTDRSDVYSYGVMLLELITGKKALMSSPPSRDPSLVNWARPLLLQAIESPDTAFTRISDTQLVDASLGTNFDQYQMIRLFHCAAAAVQYLPINRPSMSKIVRYLEGEIILSDLNASMMPADSEVRGNSTEVVETFRRTALGREDYAESSNRRSDNTPSSSSMMPGVSEMELTRMASIDEVE